MGTIKDLVDLTTQLSSSVKDRKIAGELNNIQSHILQLQSEQASLHEKNMSLREDKVKLQEKISFLEQELATIKNSMPAGPEGVPICPNCSTADRPYYMRAVGKDFQDIMDATHDCPKCKYTAKV